MLADYKKVIDILSRCTTDNVTAAEQQLHQLAKHDFQILICLQQALKDPSLQNHLYTISTSAITSIYISLISQLTQQFNYQYFTNILTDPLIKTKHKKQLNRALMYSIQQSDQQYVQKWKKFSLQMLFREDMHQVGLILLSAFTCAEVGGNLVEGVDEGVFLFSMRVLEGWMRNGDDYDKIHYNLEVWKIFVEYVIHFKQKNHRKLLYKMSQSQHFCRCLDHTYTVLSTGQHKHYLYLNTQNLQLQQITQIKSTALQLHKLLLQTLPSIKTQPTQSILYKFTGLHLQVFVNTLCFVGVQPDIRDMYQVEDMLICMVEILKIMVEIAPEILSKSWKSLMHYLVLPFLEVGREELEDFQDNTNAYIQVSQDLCEKQKMGTLKSQIANFMQRICDYSRLIYSPPSTLSTSSTSTVSSQPSPPPSQSYTPSKIAQYLINFAIASLKHNLQMQFLTNNQYLLQQGIPTDIKILSIQCSFMLLSIFSYCLDSFPKQAEDVRVILCNERLRLLPPLQRARIYTFLAYNYEEVFRNGKGKFQESIKFWLELALQENTHPTVVYCALDFVTNSLQLLYRQQTIITLCQRIPTNTSPNFWSLLKKCLHLFLPRLSPSTLTLLLQNSFLRIQSQLKSHQNTHIKTTYIITSLLQLMKLLAQKIQYLQNNGMDTVIQLLWNVKQLYWVGIEQYFQDEVVKVINCFLFYADKDHIEGHMHWLLDVFLEQFRIGGYQQTYYFVGINCFIMKGEYETTIVPIYKTLLASLQYYLGPNSKQSYRKKLPIAHTLLLLQNTIALHGNTLPPTTLHQLRPFLLPLYPTKKPNPSSTQRTKLQIYDRALLSRALNLQFLCHMYHVNGQVINELVKYHDFKIYYGYDVGVLVFCIALQIFKEKEYTNMLELLHVCIRVVYSYMEMQESQKQQPVQYQPTQQSKIDQQKNPKKASLKLRIKRTHDYQSILAYIKTPFIRPSLKILGHTKNLYQIKDIRKLLIDMFTKLHKINQALYESIIIGFSDDVKYCLEKVMGKKVEEIVRVEFGGGDGHVEMSQEDGDGKKGRKIYKVRNVRMGYIDHESDEQEDKEVLVEDVEKKSNVRVHEEDNSESDEDDSDEQNKFKSEKKKYQKRKLRDDYQ